MAAWSPQDLTNPAFVKSQLSAKDRSTALFSTSNELNSAESRLKQQEAALLAAQEAQNNGPSRGEINALKAKSNDPTLTTAEREQAAQQAANLADQRDKNNVAAANALEKFNSNKQYVNDLTAGQSNLLQAGAVPPGVNQFDSPPGYEGRSSPARDVPASQNPTATPTTTTQELQSASPALINPNSDPNTNIGAETQLVSRQQTINTNIGAEGQDVTGFEPLQEPPPTDVDEFTGIDEQVERQRQLEDGSLEFAGIDQQIANNENALQEPPALTDDEVNAYLQTAGQDETITSPNSITENVFDPSGNNGASIEENVFDPTGNQGAPRGLSTSLQDTRSQATAQDVSNFQAKPDWRVRLSLAPGAKYLYKDKAAAGILAPLAATDGVIFPYTPAISVQYAASYDATELTHSNYKFFTYRGSAVDSVTITCDFTAQDTFEANYLLAVIHFFRSVTKMFYGQDQNPKIGTPPPLCYLSGLGAFQFDAHPLAITSFNYTLPTDVDYIRAGATPTPAGVTRPEPKDNSFSIPGIRLGDLQPGGGAAPAQFNTPPGSRDVTYVPTKMSISIQAVPIVTRNDISNKFSLKEYGTGKLLRGTQRQGGGIW